MSLLQKIAFPGNAHLQKVFDQSIQRIDEGEYKGEDDNPQSNNRIYVRLNSTHLISHIYPLVFLFICQLKSGNPYLIPKAEEKTRADDRIGKQ